MKKLVLVFIASFSLLCCSQSNKEELRKIKNQKSITMYNINDFIYPEAKDMTAENFENNLISKVKHYNSEPVYYFRVNKENCLIEIYINDVVKYIDHELSNTITPIEI